MEPERIVLDTEIIDGVTYQTTAIPVPGAFASDGHGRMVPMYADYSVHVVELNDMAPERIPGP